MNFDTLPVTEWLTLNASLQKKKQTLRGLLAKKGVLKRAGENKFDHYLYFSEAQYKSLFTELLPQAGLELKFNELEYLTFEGSEKQANGRITRLEFQLHDTETGFYESTVITGEAMDKGDKAGYKAYTGAIKYFLADTFLVATGDDPEVDSPDTKADKPTETKPVRTERKASAKQIEMLKKLLNEEQLAGMLNYFQIEKIEDLTIKQASEVIAKKGGRNNGENPDDK